MKTTIYLPTAEGLNVVEGRGEAWRGRSTLRGMQLQCVAVDSLEPKRVYCGSFGRGLVQSEDEGHTWRRSSGLRHARITALCVLADGTLYAGTEPSALYGSTDHGETWAPLPSLLSLPSAPTWSFPPRPETHHVQAILQNANAPGRLYVAVEAGALLRSDDGGNTWQDRLAGSPADTHTLIANPSDSQHLVSAAGDGCFESFDGGTSWRPAMVGLDQTYCWSVAIHPSTPQILVMSASQFASTAHSPQSPRSFVYRRNGTGAWLPSMDGLDALPHVRIPVIATGVAEPNTFFLACEGEIYRSRDGAARWERLEVDWNEGDRIQRHSLSVAVSQHA